MKVFTVFMLISILVVNCEVEFGQRISKSVPKTNTTVNKEHIETKKKDLDTHESFRTYEYALAPFEVQSHLPRVIAEEHTIHELPMNEPIVLSDRSGANGKTSKPLYGAQLMPKHYGSEAPLYKDDPKEHLKGYLPIQLEPALPMHALNQIKPESSDEELVAHVPRPVSYASAHTTPHVTHVALHGGLGGNGGYRPQYRELERPRAPGYERHREPPRYEKPREHSGYERSREYSGYERHAHSDHIPGIPGSPWKDYPTYHSIPYTNFKCTHSPGYFADVEAGCQVWHYCQLDGRHDRFLCNNGTLFNQKTRVCDWWYNVDCHSSILQYSVNDDLYRVSKEHKRYLPSLNPINQYEIPLDQIQAPIQYHRQPITDLYNSGHGLIYAESQPVPQKQLIKRVRRVKLNKTNNTTDSGLAKKQTQTKH